MVGHTPKTIYAVYIGLEEGEKRTQCWVGRGYEHGKSWWKGEYDQSMNKILKELIVYMISYII